MEAAASFEDEGLKGRAKFLVPGRPALESLKTERPTPADPKEVKKEPEEKTNDQDEKQNQSGNLGSESESGEENCETAKNDKCTSASTQQLVASEAHDQDQHVVQDQDQKPAEVPDVREAQDQHQKPAEVSDGEHCEVQDEHQKPAEVSDGEHCEVQDEHQKPAEVSDGEHCEVQDEHQKPAEVSDGEHREVQDEHQKPAEVQKQENTQLTDLKENNEKHDDDLGGGDGGTDMPHVELTTNGAFIGGNDAAASVEVEKQAEVEKQVLVEPKSSTLSSGESPKPRAPAAPVQVKLGNFWKNKTTESPEESVEKRTVTSHQDAVDTVLDNADESSQENKKTTKKEKKHKEKAAKEKEKKHKKDKAEDTEKKSKKDKKEKKSKNDEDKGHADAKDDEIHDEDNGKTPVGGNTPGTSSHPSSKRKAPEDDAEHAVPDPKPKRASRAKANAKASAASPKARGRARGNGRGRAGGRGRGRGQKTEDDI